MKQKILVFLFIVCLFGCSTLGSLKTNPAVITTINQNFIDAASQYKHMMTILPEGKFPRSYDAKTDKLVTSGPNGGVVDFIPVLSCICMIKQKMKLYIMKQFEC